MFIKRILLFPQFLVLCCQKLSWPVLSAVTLQVKEEILGDKLYCLPSHVCMVLTPFHWLQYLAFISCHYPESCHLKILLAALLPSPPPHYVWILFAGENSESVAVCGAVTSQKYRLCGNEREKSRSHLILRESRGWSSRFQPFVGRADERRFCCVTVVLPLVSILKTQCYNGSRKK